MGGKALAETWNGTVSSDWNNPANWAEGTVPVSGNGVTIDNATGFAPILSASMFDGYGFSIAVNHTAGLTISNGSQVVINGVYIGIYGGSFGNLTVTGANTSLTVDQYIYIGGGPGIFTPPIIGGNGTLTVSNGGTVNLTDNGAFESWVRAGRQMGSTGNIIVTGANSTLNAGTEFDLAILGPANISVANGGLLNKTSLPSYFGYSSGNRADLTVSGANSRWTSSSPMYVADRGLSNVTVSSNGTLAMTDGANLTVGNISGANGSIIVNTNGTLSIGANSTLTLAKDSGANGTLTITNNGTLEVFAPNPIVRGNGTSNFTLGNSTFRLGADLTLNISANMEANGRTVGVDTNGFNGTWNVSLSGSTGGISFVKKGAGQLMFNVTRSWITTRVEDGTLYFDAAHAPTTGLGLLTMNATKNPAIIVTTGSNISTGLPTSINGTAIVTGATAQWRAVGTTLSGNLFIDHGGNFSNSGSLTLAPLAPNMTANITVNGTNSQLVSSTLGPALPGNLAVVVSNGGLAKVGSITISATGTQSTRTLTLANGTIQGGSVTMGGNSLFIGSGIIVTNGTLSMQAGSRFLPDALTVFTGNIVLAGNATFALNDLGNFSQVTLSGAGNLTYGGNLTLDVGADARAGIYPLFAFPTKVGDFASVSLTGAATGAMSGSGGVWGTSVSGRTFTLDTATGWLRIALAAPAATWEDWQDAYFTAAQLANPAVSGYSATPANDGVPNLVKYAFNLDAWTSQSDALPPTAVNGGNLTLTFTKLHDELEYAVEASEDLARWSTDGVAIQTSGNVVTASYPLPPPPGQAFLHILITPVAPPVE